VLLQSYGQTEAPNSLLILNRQDHVGLSDAQLAAAGRPSPLMQLRLLDDQGQEVPQGERGEICARGPLLMSGCWQCEAETAAALAGLPGPLRVDAAFFDGPVGLEPAPVVLAAALAGQPADRFAAFGPAGVVLLCSGEATPADPAPGELLLSLPAGRALRFVDRPAAAAWLRDHPQPPGQVGGALDWAKALRPGDPRVEDLLDAPP
jgi:acyl-CoA synthetase (AMP-forming)/AMP-acid ligase II